MNAQGTMTKTGTTQGRGAIALALVACLGLGACVAPANVGRGGASRPVAAGPVVNVDGKALSGQILDGAPGLTVTAQGAQPIQGQTVRVSQSGGRQLGQSDGSLAKTAAREICQGAGRSFSDLALGGYDQGSGTWVFAGACA